MSYEVAAIYDFIDDGAGDFHPDDIKGSDSVFLIGRVDGLPVACGAIRPLEPGVAEVKRMFVSRDHRGRGYSKAMLSALEAFAKSVGYSAIRLETGDLLTAAISLYESAGYIRAPKYGIYIDSERSVCFEKIL